MPSKKQNKRKTPKKRVKKSKNSNENKNSNKININLSAGGGGGGGGGGSSGGGFSFPIPYQQPIHQFSSSHTDPSVSSIFERVLNLEKNSTFNSVRNDHSSGNTVGGRFRDPNQAVNVLQFADPSTKDFNEAETQTHPILGDGVEGQFTPTPIRKMNIDFDSQPKTPKSVRFDMIHPNDSDDDEQSNLFNNPVFNRRRRESPPLRVREIEHKDHDAIYDGLEDKVKEIPSILENVEHKEGLVEGTTVVIRRRKGGRPPGRKNKPKIYAEPVYDADTDIAEPKENFSIKSPHFVF